MLNWHFCSCYYILASKLLCFVSNCLLIIAITEWPKMLLCFQNSHPFEDENQPNFFAKEVLAKNESKAARV